MKDVLPRTGPGEPAALLEIAIRDARRKDMRDAGIGSASGLGSRGELRIHGRLFSNQKLNSARSTNPWSMTSPNVPLPLLSWSNMPTSHQYSYW
jgi:hypothetical protein